MSQRPPSPRTPEEPMAFTRDELLGGCLRVWVIFMVLLLVFSLLYSLPLGGIAGLAFGIVLGGYAVALGGPIALVVTVTALPLCWVIGRALRRRPRILMHLLVYTALGTAAAGAATAVMWLMFGSIPFFALLPSSAALVSVPLGWWLTERKALRRDKTAPTRRLVESADPDALAEDAL